MTHRRFIVLVHAALVAPLLVGAIGCSGATPAAGLGALPPEAGPSQIISRTEWSFRNNPGQIIRTPRFRLYTTELNPDLREPMGDFLEQALDHYRSAIVDLPAPERALDVYLMDSRSQWQQVTLQLMGERAQTLNLIGRGGYAHRGIGVYYDIGLPDTFAIAAHEGWHQYTQRSFREPLPIWLEEGIATYMEGFRSRGGRVGFLPWANLARFETLQEASRNGTLFPLSEIMNARPEDLVQEGTDGELVTYYAQLWALLHFLHEGRESLYAGSLQAVLRDAAEGRLRDRLTDLLGAERANLAIATRTGTDVLEAYFGIGLDELQSEFDAFVLELSATGARSHIVEGTSPLGR